MALACETSRASAPRGAGPRVSPPAGAHHGPDPGHQSAEPSLRGRAGGRRSGLALGAARPRLRRGAARLCGRAPRRHRPGHRWSRFRRSGGASAVCDAFGGAPPLAACWWAGLGALALALATDTGCAWPCDARPAPRRVVGVGTARWRARGSPSRAASPTPSRVSTRCCGAAGWRDVGEALPLRRAAAARSRPAPLPDRRHAGRWARDAGRGGGGAVPPARRGARWARRGGLRARRAVAGTCWAVRVAASAEAFDGAWRRLGAVPARSTPSRPRPAAARPLLCVVCGPGAHPGRAGPPLPFAKAARRPCRRSRARRRSTPKPASRRRPTRGSPRLPAGLVLSTIDPGSQILAYTHHAVLAAPYHRNAYGNRARAAVLRRRRPTRPRGDRARTRAPRYVALCLTSPEVVDDAARRPTGSRPASRRAAPPDWLRPARPADGPVRVFGVATSACMLLPTHAGSMRGSVPA